VNESNTRLSINIVKPNDKKFIEVLDCLINQSSTRLWIYFH